ncbi:hypothetical protein DFH28DRAFT_907019 [Melampsora americana]|nr:hypothetical protein DFH28DRAFT_907019 [Melampsora americana]
MAPDTSDTGQTAEDNPTNKSSSEWTDPNASSRSNDAIAAFLKGSDQGLSQVEITTETLGLSPERTEVPHLTEFSRKRARASTPGLSAQDHVQSITGTPRCEQMARLVPGCEDDRTLTSLLTRLVEVTNASIQLPAKGRMAKNVSINVDTAADILVLVNAAYDKHQADLYRKVLFKPAAEPASSTRAAAPLPNPSPRPSASFDFQADSIIEKLDGLTEKFTLLASNPAVVRNLQPTTASALGISNQQKAGRTGNPSYAAAAAKNTAPDGQSQVQSTGPRVTPAPRPKRQMANTITLSQIDRSTAALADLSIIQLIQGFNGAFKTHNLKLEDSSKSTITVKTVQRHPSNDLVLHFKSPAHAEKIRLAEKSWLPGISSTLQMKQDQFTILVHGIPTSFDPLIKSHCEELGASNPDLLQGALFVQWLSPKVKEDPSKRYSTLLIGFPTQAQADKCV